MKYRKNRKNRPTSPLLSLLTMLAVGAPLAAQSAPALPFPVNLPVPGVDQLHFDQPGDGNLWVHGRSYKASFGPEGATYIPFLGSDVPRNFPLRFALAEVSVDGVAVPFEERPEARRDGDSVVLNRGRFEEVYELELDTIEQTFRFPSLPAEGDLSIAIDVDTDLERVAGPDGELRFTSEYGTVAYSSALVVDAVGSRMPIATEATDGRIELRVPRTTLANLTFPVTVDPVISRMPIYSGTMKTYKSSVAYDATHERFMVVWDVEYSWSDRDGWAAYWARTGAFVNELVSIDMTDESWRTPDVANSNRYDTFLVVAERSLPGSRRIGVRTRAATGELGAQGYLDAGGSYECSAPSVGGDPAPDGSTYFCVAYRQHWNEDTVRILASLANPSGGPFGSPRVIDGTDGVTNRRPRVSRSNGVGSVQSKRWNIAWAREMDGGWDIHGAQMSRDGSVILGPFAIDTSADHNKLPVPSSPLDELPNGDRPWLVTYERSAGQEIVCTVMKRQRKSLPVSSLRPRREKGWCSFPVLLLVELNSFSFIFGS